MKRIKLFGIGIILILLVTAVIVYSQTEDEEEDDGNPKSTSRWDKGDWPDWYDHESWYITEEHIEICEGWGGVEGLETGTASGLTAAADVIDFTVTLQGQKTILYDTTLYETAWYVQPLAGSVAYEIYLIDENGDEEEIYSGFSEDISGDSNYDARESEIIDEIEVVYEYVVMRLEQDLDLESDIPGVDDNEIKVPFVEKD